MLILKYFWWHWHPQNNDPWKDLYIDAFCVIITCPIYSKQKQSPGGVLKNFAKFKGKHQCQSLSLIKFQSLGPDLKRPWHRCFPANFATFLRTSFLTEHLLWLLLSKMWLALQFSIFRVSSFIEDFLLISLQQKNEKKKKKRKIPW